MATAMVVTAKARRDRKVRRVPKVRSVLKDRKARRVTQVPRVRKVRKGLQVKTVLR